MQILYKIYNICILRMHTTSTHFSRINITEYTFKIYFRSLKQTEVKRKKLRTTELQPVKFNQIWTRRISARVRLDIKFSGT
jgi:hypothetical protein